MPALAMLVTVVALVPGFVVISFFPERLGRRAANDARQLDSRERTETNEGVFRSKGWQTEAARTLQGFLEAETIAERAAYTLKGEENIPAMEEFYGRRSFDELDTALVSFSPVPLPEKDASRGIFLMNYNRPEQYDIRRYFRPVAPLRVEYDLEEMSPWLKQQASPENFLAEPVRVMAYFFRTPDGMRLDWETFAQTKYRLFRDFVEQPQPGESQVFRVFLQQDVDLEGRAVDGTTVYRLSDPAYQEDHVKILVKDESEMGRAFECLQWEGQSGEEAPVRSGTVALKWSQAAKPILEMKRFLCWQFLGLGGELDNWREDVTARAPSPKSSP
jgi:catechol 2,3-dioxygenase-like lactoylglutathione lyase family enzyme